MYVFDGIGGDIGKRTEYGDILVDLSEAKSRIERGLPGSMLGLL